MPHGRAVIFCPVRGHPRVREARDGREGVVSPSLGLAPPPVRVARGTLGVAPPPDGVAPPPDGVARGNFPVAPGVFPVAPGDFRVAPGILRVAPGTVPVAQGNFPLAQGILPLAPPMRILVGIRSQNSRWRAGKEVRGQGSEVSARQAHRAGRGSVFWLDAALCASRLSGMWIPTWPIP